MDQSSQGLLSKLSLQDLPEAKQKEIMAQLDQVVEGRVELAIREKLSEDVLKQLDDLVEADKDEEVLDVIKQHIPDYDEMVGKIADDTIDELANNKDAVMAEVDRMRSEADSAQDTSTKPDAPAAEEPKELEEPPVEAVAPKSDDTSTSADTQPVEDDVEAPADKADEDTDSANGPL